MWGLCSLVVVTMWNPVIAIACVDVLSLITTARGLCRIAVVAWGLCGCVIAMRRLCSLIVGAAWDLVIAVACVTLWASWLPCGGSATLSSSRRACVAVSLPCEECGLVVGATRVGALGHIVATQALCGRVVVVARTGALGRVVTQRIGDCSIAR